MLVFDWIEGSCQVVGRVVLKPAQGPVSRKPRKLFGPVKPFLVHLYLKTVKCIRLKLLV